MAKTFLSRTVIIFNILMIIAAGGVECSERIPMQIGKLNGESRGIKVAASGNKEARAVSLLRAVIKRPKVSPLYLINGTVCRFVNAQPICTTLSTTGIARKYTVDKSSVS